MGLDGLRCGSWRGRCEAPLAFSDYGVGDSVVILLHYEF